MWAAIAGLVLSIIKYLFGQRQQQEGVAQGRAEARAEGAERELNDVQKADAAAAAVDAAPLNELRQDDGFRRD